MNINLISVFINLYLKNIISGIQQVIIL